MSETRSPSRSRPVSPLLATLACILVPFTACRDTTAPVAGATAAFIQPSFSSVPLFEVLGEARAGRPIVVQINTFGLDSCWGRERTDVAAGALTIITPYNRTSSEPGTFCLAAIRRIEHAVTLSYPTPGEKQLLIRGRAFDTREPIVFPVTLSVKP